MNKTWGFNPNFGITIYLNQNSKWGMSAVTRAIGRLNRGHPSLAVLHKKPQPHIHNLIRLPLDEHDVFITSLYQRFELENRKGLFRPICDEEDIQIEVRNTKRFVEYVLDVKDWTDKEPSIVWAKGHSGYVDATRSDNRAESFSSPVLLPAWPQAVAQRKNEVPQREQRD